MAFLCGCCRRAAYISVLQRLLLLASKLRLLLATACPFSCYGSGTAVEPPLHCSSLEKRLESNHQTSSVVVVVVFFGAVEKGDLSVHTRTSRLPDVVV